MVKNVAQMLLSLSIALTVHVVESIILLIYISQISAAFDNLPNFVNPNPHGWWTKISHFFLTPKVLDV
jgi:hypothetical protein